MTLITRANSNARAPPAAARFLNKYPSAMAATQRHVDLAGAAEEPVHYLAHCRVGRSAAAPVGAYFRPEASGATADGEPVLSAAFRGRALLGARLALPAGYAGAVLERAPPGSPSAGPPGWRAASTFSELHYWLHDAQPGRGDGVRRAVEWAALAARVHAPVSPAEVDAAMAAAAAPASA